MASENNPGDVVTVVADRVETRYVDKSKWATRGEWDDEPDKVEWRWAGPPRLPCLIVRGGGGALCGYVGVPPGHPWHGKHYNDLPSDIGAPGGLTYAEKCQPGGRICHVAKPGESDDVWWLGFDCAHSWDICPVYQKPEDRTHGESYKSAAFVRRRVHELAEQAARAANPDNIAASVTP